MAEIIEDYKVLIKDVGNDRDKVVDIIVEQTDHDEDSADSLFDLPDATIVLGWTAANKLKKALEAAGATVEIK